MSDIKGHVPIKSSFLYALPIINSIVLGLTLTKSLPNAIKRAEKKLYVSKWGGGVERKYFFAVTNKYKCHIVQTHVKGLIMRGLLSHKDFPFRSCCEYYFDTSRCVLNCVLEKSI